MIWKYADIVASKNHKEFFEKGIVESVLDNPIIDILNSADYRIYNLETPITNIWTPI